MFATTTRLVLLERVEILHLDSATPSGLYPQKLRAKLCLSSANSSNGSGSPPPKTAGKDPGSVLCTSRAEQQRENLARGGLSNAQVRPLLPAVAEHPRLLLAAEESHRLPAVGQQYGQRARRSTAARMTHKALPRRASARSWHGSVLVGRMCRKPSASHLRAEITSNNNHGTDKRAYQGPKYITQITLETARIQLEEGMNMSLQRIAWQTCSLYVRPMGGVAVTENEAVAAQHETRTASARGAPPTLRPASQAIDSHASQR